jgi:hypothetical protein
LLTLLDGAGTLLGGPELMTEMFLRDICELSCCCRTGADDRQRE